MPIYTKKGDEGFTSLIGGVRVIKNHPRVIAYGAIDELNASIGLARSTCPKSDVKMSERLEDIQRLLFLVESELATPFVADKASSVGRIDRGAITALEREIDEVEKALPVLKKFILPGGMPFASHLFLSCTICRRAEREVVTLHEKEAVSANVLQFLNRLSDWLFVFARKANANESVADAIV